MQVFFIASMCVINLVLWIVFFVKFKNLFTADNEIQKAREQYELLLNDVNRNTLSNIDLIDSKIEELNIILQEAEKMVFVLQNDKKIVNTKSALKLNVRNKNIQSKNKAKTYEENDNYVSSLISQDDAFEVKIDKRSRKKQAELFTNDENLKANSTQKRIQKSVHYVDSKGNGYGEIPIMSSKVYMTDDAPVEKEKTLREKVQQFLALGYDVEQIASALNRSITEVQLVVDTI